MKGHAGGATIAGRHCISDIAAADAKIVEAIMIELEQSFESIAASAGGIDLSNPSKKGAKRIGTRSSHMGPLA